MRHPFDLVGSRRAFVIFGVLNDVLKKKNTNEIVDTTKQENDSDVEVQSQSDISSFNMKKVYITTTVFVLMKFVFGYIFDYVTDILFIRQNYVLSQEVSTALTENLLASKRLHEMGYSRKSFINSIPRVFPLVLLVISTLLTIPKLACLKKLIKIRCDMKDPETEKHDVQVDIDSVVTRHDSYVVESSTESSVQIMIQWGSFMGLIYLIDRIMHDQNLDANLACIEEEQINARVHNLTNYGLQPIVCKLNSEVAFATNELLWISGLASVISMTRTQLKAHNTPHEFCTSSGMKAAYLCAGLMNTISYVFLLVSCFASSLDLNNLIMDILEAQGLSDEALDILRQSFPTVCLCIIVITSYAARFIVFKHIDSSDSQSSFMVENPGSLVQKNGWRNICSGMENTVWKNLQTCTQNKFWKNLNYMIKNTLKFFTLPTSQYSYNVH